MTTLPSGSVLKGIIGLEAFGEAGRGRPDLGHVAPDRDGVTSPPRAPRRDREDPDHPARRLHEVYTRGPFMPIASSSGTVSGTRRSVQLKRHP
jgi:hypothetical protein